MLSTKISADESHGIPSIFSMCPWHCTENIIIFIYDIAQNVCACRFVSVHAFFFRYLDFGRYESKWCQITYDTTVEVSFYARKSNWTKLKGERFTTDVTHSAPFSIIIVYINIYSSLFFGYRYARLYRINL